MLRRQTLIAIGIALILGLVAVYLANTYLLAADKRANLSGTTKIAVAAVPLDYGAEITPEKIRFAEYPNSSIPAGSFDRVAALLPVGKKRVALMPIQPNEPILPAKISGAGEGASIAALLPAGMRATSIRINDVSGVAGFIQPNDSVDVLITRSVAGRDDQVTDVLMQNVRVLASGQDSKNADGKPQLAKTATVLVDQVGAQKLALGQQVGSLSLVLRKAGEEDNPVVETVSLGDLRYNMYGGVRYPAPATVGAYQQQPAPVAKPRRIVRAAPARRPAPTAPAGTNVQVYRGVESNSYTVGGR
jgi:pilus assembly protein CpaB